MSIIRGLDEQFALLHERSIALVQRTPAENLYCKPVLAAGRSPAGATGSVGDLILKSASVVEQTFGGITVNLWDDPFEWTLPEALPKPGDVLNYLAEVEATRLRGFETFQSDADLTKTIATPSGELRTLLSLISETLARASHFQGRAFATFRFFSDLPLPRL